MNLKYDDVPLFSFKGLCTIGKISHIIDGDTTYIILLDKESQPIKLDCRLVGIDTPEMRKTHEMAMKSRNRLLQLSTNCIIDIDDATDKNHINKLIDTTNTKLLFIECYGNDKYGRQLVKLFTDNEKKKCINEIMINEGYAHSYDGGKKEEWNH